MLGAGQIVTSDIYHLDHIVRHTGIVHGRNILIDTLREIFARDSNYRYITDIFGFPKTPDHTGLDIDAGLVDQTTTRLFIGTTYRYEISYLPAITVRQTNSQYRPVSFNQNKLNIQYELQRMEDGYGNVSFLKVPSRYLFAGAWEQSFELKVLSHSQEDTAAIADVVMVSLQNTYRDIMERNGLFVKRVSASGEQSEQSGNNDPVFSISLSVDTYSEWRREIPISNLVDRIQLCFHFDIGSDLDPPATGLDFKMVFDE